MRSETGIGTPSPQGANSRDHPSTALTAGRVLSARKRPHSHDPATSLALTLTNRGSPTTLSDGFNDTARTSTRDCNPALSLPSRSIHRPLTEGTCAPAEPTRQRPAAGRD